MSGVQFKPVANGEGVVVFKEDGKILGTISNRQDYLKGKIFVVCLLGREDREYLSLDFAKDAVKRVCQGE